MTKTIYKIEELEPCNSCGKNAHLMLDLTGKNYGKYIVICGNCMQKTYLYETPEEAVSAWNRREK